MAGKEAFDVSVTPVVPTDTTRFIGQASAGADGVAEAQQLREYIALKEPANANIAVQSVPAGATTYLTDSQVTLPGTSKVKIRTTVKWRVYISKGAVGAVALTPIVKVGVNGTTADTSACSFAFVAGTAVADVGYLDITWIVVGPLTNACVSRGAAMLHHQLATTGFTTTNPAIVTAPTVVNFDATTATKIGLAFLTGAALVVSVNVLDVFTENL